MLYYRTFSAIPTVPGLNNILLVGHILRNLIFCLRNIKTYHFHPHVHNSPKITSFTLRQTKLNFNIYSLSLSTISLAQSTQNQFKIPYQITLSKFLTDINFTLILLSKFHSYFLSFFNYQIPNQISTYCHLASLTRFQNIFLDQIPCINIQTLTTL